MGLVDDDGVVLFQVAVVLGLGEQNAVGHQFDQRTVLALILEAHLIADQLTERRTDLLGHPRGHTARRQPSWLGVADQAMLATTDLQADLRQLGGLARAGFAGDHQHLMLFQRRLDLVALGSNRQGVVIAHHRHAQAPRLDLGARRLKTLQPLRLLGVIGLFLQLMQLPAQTMAVGDHGVVEVLLQGGDIEGGVGHQARGGSRKSADCRRFSPLRAGRAVEAGSEPPMKTARSTYALLRVELQLRRAAAEAAGQPGQVKAAEYQPGAAEHDRQAVEAGHQP